MTRTTSGPVDGWVVRWHGDLGWGVLASSAVDGDVWAHCSSVLMDGYRSLNASQLVSFVYETPGQDGYAHRSVSVTPRS